MYHFDISHSVQMNLNLDNFKKMLKTFSEYITKNVSDRNVGIKISKFGILYNKDILNQTNINPLYFSPSLFLLSKYSAITSAHI